jgi:Raf kinase inhibitor-like YbhB/YbcL family protein
MELTSTAFEPSREIPKRYTGEGENVSPELRWSGVPPRCREFALICEDPDAPKRPGVDHPYVHWIAYHISPEVTSLPEGVPTDPSPDLPVRLQQGKNSFGEIGYGGPMPPVGHGKHRYVFRLYALNSELGLRPGATKDDLLGAIRDHVVAEAELVGVYAR